MGLTSLSSFHEPRLHIADIADIPIPQGPAIFKLAPMFMAAPLTLPSAGVILGEKNLGTTLGLGKHGAKKPRKCGFIQPEQ
jgi:hypothetical protein